MTSIRNYVTIGALIFLFLGIFYGFKRLFVNFVVFQIIDALSSSNDMTMKIASLTRWAIYVVSFIYIVIAIIGLINKEKRSMVVLSIGIAIVILSIAEIITHGGMLAYFRELAGLFYVYPNLNREII